MKKLLFFSLLLLFTDASYSQIKYDTLLSYKAGPGIIYTKVRVPSVPWLANILEIDMKNPAVKIETAKANDVLNGAAEIVSSIAARKNSNGHFVIGAVNGDFFTGGNPIQMQIQNGEILKRERTDGLYASVAFSPGNEVEFVSPKFSGSVNINGKAFQITGVNESRVNDKLVMYNSFYGASTKTGAGTEVILHPLKEWSVNDTVECTVDSINLSSGNLQIPKGSVVLSGSGLAGDFLSSQVKKGDIVKIYTKATSGLKRIKELIGGHPFIMKNGAIAGIDPNDPMLFNRHPRTLVGISKDTTRLFLVVVDGRQVTSAGMTVWEAVDFLKSIGVNEAMNLDGGGSSTMAVRTKVVNTPSESGVERPVGNSLMVVSSLHSGSLKRIILYPGYERTYIGEKVKFTIMGSDSNDNPAAVNPALLEFSVSKDLGTIDNAGIFTAGNNAGKGYVYVKYNSAVDSALVEIKSLAKMEISPKSTVIDLHKSVGLKVRGFDIDGIERSVALNSLSWKSVNEAIAHVDSSGKVYGKTEGAAKIIASFSSSVGDTAEIIVQEGKGIQSLSSMEDKSVWMLSGQNIDTSFSKISISVDNKTEGTGGLKVDYRFTYDPSKANYIYLNTLLPVYGIPDTLFIDARSDSTYHRLSYVFSDDNDELFRISAYGYIDNPAGFDVIPAQMKSFASTGSGTFFYPVKLTRIEIQLQYKNAVKTAGQTYSGAIYLDNLRVKYPDNTSGAEQTQEIGISKYSLSQNYPNPFNPVTVINYSIPKPAFVKLSVFDILGNKVADLVNEEKTSGNYSVKFNGDNLSSGVYFYRIETGNFISTKKLLLLK